MPPKKTSGRKTTTRPTKKPPAVPAGPRLGSRHFWLGGLAVVVGLVLLAYLAYGAFVMLTGPTDGFTRLLTNIFFYPAAGVSVPGYLPWMLLSALMSLLLILSFLYLAFVGLTTRRKHLGKVVAAGFFLVTSIVALSTSVPMPTDAKVGYHEYLDRTETLRKIAAQRQQGQQGQQMPAPKDEEVRSQALDQLVKNRIIVQEATKLDVSVSKKEVDELYKQQADRLQGEDKLKRQLKDQLGWSPGEFKREVIRFQLLQRKLNEKLTSDPEINKDQRTKAEDLLKQAKEGKDFAEVAKQSDDPAAAGAADSGFVKRGESEPAIENAVFALQPGQVSEIITTERGFVIARLEEKRGADEVRFRQILVTTKSLQEYLQTTLKDSKVTVYADDLVWDSTLFAIQPKNPQQQPQPSETASPAPAASPPAGSPVSPPAG